MNLLQKAAQEAVQLYDATSNNGVHNQSNLQ